MSLNLHDIVRGAINANLSDQTFTLYRSVGEQNSKGIKTALYVKVEGLSGNLQSEGDAALSHAEMAGQNSITRKLYLYASSDPATRAWSIYRPLARSGDFVRDHNGAYWLVVAVTEDFSDAGWEQLRIQLQETTPQLTLQQEDTVDE